MGQRLVHLLQGDAEARVSAAIERSGHPLLGMDIGAVCGLPSLGVAVTETLPAGLDAVIDFSIPSASVTMVRACVERGTAVMVATTGHSAEERSAITLAAEKVPVVFAANTSVVVNLLFKLAAETGRALKGRDFDVEIIEQHHRYKVDSPSGTALRFAEIIEKEMGLDRRQHGREGVLGQRPRNELGLHAVRAGDNVGEHTILFSTLGETLELVHKSTSRDSYAKGAIAAAKFLAGKPAGMYSMMDVLGL
jgi:4-hydroxy-tetrahydrodipicolinate reductase